MKKACKGLRKKFACSVAFTKKGGYIEMSGDYIMQVSDYLIKTYENVRTFFNILLIFCLD